MRYLSAVHHIAVACVVLRGSYAMPGDRSPSAAWYAPLYAIGVAYDQYRPPASCGCPVRCPVLT
eukprot:2183325-Rhodomonas_salina.4